METPTSPAPEAAATTPLVSVVIPSFNNAGFIEETVASVLAQTYTNFELIVADHTSTDGTWELLQRFLADRRVRLYRTAPGGGAERNWNAVTRLARGEYLKLVCGDDLLRPDSLALQVAALEAAGAEAVMAASPRDVVDARGRLLIADRGLAGLRGAVPGTAAIRTTVRAGTNIFGEPACVLIRRSTLAQIGGWDGTYGYFIDLATYYIAARPETIGALLEVASRVRSGPLEITSLVRHSEYQEALKTTNGNANTSVPMHTMGLAFDIALVNTPLKTVYEIRDVLRRMQAAGDILVIGERQQLVFHVVPHPSRLGHFMDVYAKAVADATPGANVIGLPETETATRIRWPRSSRK